mmetsp:Transcript_93457/g.234784  ORF Transcript_93457/g.234784 Transcript_93457/m.234784 type:complete len:335 (-) Transcript_93457:379-1383(-)
MFEQFGLQHRMQGGLLLLLAVVRDFILDLRAQLRKRDGKGKALLFFRDALDGASLNYLLGAFDCAGKLIVQGGQLLYLHPCACHCANDGLATQAARPLSERHLDIAGLIEGDADKLLVHLWQKSLPCSPCGTKLQPQPRRRANFQWGAALPVKTLLVALHIDSEHVALCGFVPLGCGLQLGVLSLQVEKGLAHCSIPLVECHLRQLHVKLCGVAVLERDRRGYNGGPLDARNKLVSFDDDEGLTIRSLLDHPNLTPGFESMCQLPVDDLLAFHHEYHACALICDFKLDIGFVIFLARKEREDEHGLTSLHPSVVASFTGMKLPNVLVHAWQDPR